MPFSIPRAFAAGLIAALVLGACSQSSNSPQDNRRGQADVAAQAVQAQANRELAMYRSLLAKKNYELAAPIGQEIAARFARTTAAVEVQKTLADVVAKAKASSEQRRMKRLWSYQSGTESGGVQNTASIYSSEPQGLNDRIRLVLRRHSQWGQSVYLFGHGAGFVCAGKCSLAIHFDDKPPRRFRAYLPPTGEPALFIEDDARFISEMQKAHKLWLDVTLKDKGSQRVVIEVGGYDASKFPELPKAAHGRAK
ncbi:MAG: hypothetical protein WB784_05040 [Rhodanobacteraceae bacterium]